mmetsp:Transcript_21700/g.70088  ORF Transcript_21700/g.70088 Transcript_21700/m.70088 type:complete len:223 (+) Transcript_21700:291-959(+)
MSRRKSERRKASSTSTETRRCAMQVTSTRLARHSVPSFRWRLSTSATWAPSRTSWPILSTRGGRAARLAATTLSPAGRSALSTHFRGRCSHRWSSPPFASTGLSCSWSLSRRNPPARSCCRRAGCPPPSGSSPSRCSSCLLTCLPTGSSTAPCARSATRCSIRAPHPHAGRRRTLRPRQPVLGRRGPAIFDYIASRILSKARIAHCGQSVLVCAHCDAAQGV